MSETRPWTRRTFGWPPLQALGAAFVLFGAFMIYTACTRDFMIDRGVRTPGQARVTQVATFVIGSLLDLLGGFLVLCGSGITIDRARGTIRQWTSVGPFTSGRSRPLSAFSRVAVEKYETSDRRVRFRVSVVGPGQEPIVFENAEEEHRFALREALTIAGASGLPVDDPLAPAPPKPTDVQLNRALAVYQQFGPERATPVEERWSEELPDLPRSAHPELLARCEEIEGAAGMLADQVVGGTLGQDAGKVELGRQFPFLDADRLAHTWSQALYYAARG